MLATGLLCFVAGVSLLAFAGYSTLTGDDASRAEGPPVVHLTPKPTAKPTATRPPTSSPTPVPTPPLGDQPYVMIIDKIGVNNPVQAFGLDENAAPIVPTGPGAEDVVAWYDFSAKPGIGSNAVFAGHVTWEGPAVFYNLTSMAAGDEIKLLGQDGTLLTYKVSEVFSVSASDPNALSVMAGTPTDMMTIITCDGTFTDTNDPVFGGEYNNRLVVRAGLETVTPGQPAAAAQQ
jgi:LPXTG-site transpeptidase (sortase) family protein